MQPRITNYDNSIEDVLTADKVYIMLVVPEFFDASCSVSSKYAVDNFAAVVRLTTSNFEKSSRLESGLYHP
jgi:hypothetical protein